ncbi:MAG: hypothetical protein M1828_001465 [Chrysothrix sp. TS-e1954]|nr:MAG: hypothetical protein M1828_001465 [Chrysothrix sp. TS-e1954]
MASRKSWIPVYDTDELPKEAYPKSLRRPITEKPEKDDVDRLIDEYDLGDISPEAEDDSDEEDSFLDEDAGSRVPSSILAKKPATISKRVRGGRPAYHKKVTRDLDSDDEIILEMKKLGCRDKEIQARLIVEGRTRYSERTISTRHARLRRFQRAYQNLLLDEELTDWHEGDDDVLKAAYVESEPTLNQLLDDVRNKHWQQVSEQVAERMGGVARFSQKACQERFAALENDTARIPPELDPDQVNRQYERSEKQKANAKRRAERLLKEQTDAQGVIDRRNAREQERIESRARRENREATKIERHAAAEEQKRARKEKQLSGLYKYREERNKRTSLLNQREAARIARERLENERKSTARIVRQMGTEKRRMLAGTTNRLKRGDAAMKKAAAEQQHNKEQAFIEKIMVDNFMALLENGQHHEEAAWQHLEEERLRICNLVMNGQGIDQFMAGAPDPGRKTAFLTLEGAAPTVESPLVEMSRRVGKPASAAGSADVATPTSVTRSSCAARPASSTIENDDLTDVPTVTGHSHSALEVALPPSFRPAADPRFELSVATLKAMCRNRALIYSGEKADLVTNLAEADAKLLDESLHIKLKRSRLATSGSRKIWLMRLAANDAKIGGNSGFTMSSKPSPRQNTA